MWGRRRRWEGCEVCCGEAGGLAPNPSGCPCCSSGEDDNSPRGNLRTWTRRARAPRSAAGIERRKQNGILPGDLIQITEGFFYIPGGSRTRYLRFERLIRKG